MAESLDDLYRLWQSDPSPARTASLCEALAGSARHDLVELVGSHAARQLDVRSLRAAARMYAATGRLDDAQQVLVAAGRLAPRDGDLYGHLGEVLLRRGDAARAEKVLVRALELGDSAPGTGVWLDRARALLPTQHASGVLGVTEALARQGVTGKGPNTREELAPLSLPPSTDRSAPLQLEADVDAVLGASIEERVAPQTSSVALPPPSPGMSAGTAPVAASPQPRRPAPAQGPEPAPVLDPAAPLAPATGASRSRGSAPPPHGSPLAASHSVERPGIPEARDVLDALESAGIFEPEGAVRPQTFAWDRPANARRRVGSIAALISLAVLLVGGASGTYAYVTDRRTKQHAQAEALLATVDADLAKSDTRLLEPSERAIATAFDLESRSPHAALTWLHERALLGLLKGGENVAFEDGTQRAKEVGVADKRLAFAQVAGFLFQGDTAGAAAAIAKWEGRADDDAWYQLVAGATFERAGDARALDRYAAAVKLEPGLVIAQLLLARATAVDGDPRQAAELAKDLRAKYPDRVEGPALVALAWARDAMRGEPPAEARDLVEKAEALPAPLRAVAPAVRALLAIEAHKSGEARSALQRGLAVADTPGIAAWLGSIALATGDEALARRGALAAVSFSAAYPPARMLAARVALLGARLDEALKASEELPPSSTDVAIVTAAVAYEKLDGERMRSALDALPDDAKRLPFLGPLVRGQALMGGSASALPGAQALDMADDEAPWADLVALDAALEVGDLELAHKVGSRWQGEPSVPRPLRAVRLARLARWEGKLEDAERFSRTALEGGTVTVRALAERVFVLVAMNRATEATPLFKAHANVGGPTAKWLRAYAVASHGKLEEARAIVSQEDPPPQLAALGARTVAAMAFGAMKDSRRGSDYLKALLAAGFANPDVAAAAERVGAAKPARKR